MKTSRFLPFALTALLCVVGCSREPSPPSESETIVTELLARTFKGSEEYWFAVNKSPGSQKGQLVELHNPHASLFPLNVTETDQMNGISQRFKVVVDCTQSRSFDKNWTPWQDGTAGKNFLLNSFFPGAAAGYWIMQFEKKDGEWHARNIWPVNNLTQDDALLDTLMRKAGVSP